MERERATGLQQPPCWCTGVDFSPELLGRLPEAALGRACICRACARTAGAGKGPE
jgi:hypothetical protein